MDVMYPVSHQRFMQLSSHDRLFDVATKEVSGERTERQQSIRPRKQEWETALTAGK